MQRLLNFKRAINRIVKPIFNVEEADLITPEVGASTLEEVEVSKEEDEIAPSVKSAENLVIWPGIVSIDMISHIKILLHNSQQNTP